jgi:SAM-dependent methyltransferase
LPTLAAAISARLDLVPGQIALVAPCADGRMPIALAAASPRGVRILGVDHDRSAIARAREATEALPTEISRDLAWRVASPQALTIASGSCGGAVAEASLLPDGEADAIVGEIARAVLPGGWVVVVPNDLDNPGASGLCDLLVRGNLRQVGAGVGFAWGRKAL